MEVVEEDEVVEIENTRVSRSVRTMRPKKR